MNNLNPKKLRMTESGCVLWTGRQHKGYGRVSRGSKREGQRTLHVHRIAYESVHGPIPNGVDIHHICRNKLCVNPGHLRAMSPQEHHKAHEGDRPKACPQGHAYDKANTYIGADGWMRCRACGRQRMRERYWRKRGMSAPIQD